MPSFDMSIRSMLLEVIVAVRIFQERPCLIVPVDIRILSAAPRTADITGSVLKWRYELD